MHLLAADRLATTKGTIMFVSLLAFSVVLASPQDIAPPVPVGRPDRYENAMRCAGVMAATSALHAFTGNAEAQARSDRNGRGFITAASVFAQPLGLTQEQLSEAFNASTARGPGFDHPEPGSGRGRCRHRPAECGAQRLPRHGPGLAG
jgi:hypothetical protein